MPGTPLPTAQQLATGYTPHEHEELSGAAQAWRDARPDTATDTQRTSIFAERRRVDQAYAGAGPEGR